MSIRVRCSRCETICEVTDSQAGTKICCKECQGFIAVPDKVSGTVKEKQPFTKQLPATRTLYLGCIIGGGITAAALIVGTVAFMLTQGPVGDKGQMADKSQKEVRPPEEKVLTVPVKEEGSWTDSDAKTTHPRTAWFSKPMPDLPYKAYRVHLKAGQVYSISLSTVKLQPAYLIIEDKTGQKVASTQDKNGNPTYTYQFTPSADGEYRLLAMPYFKTVDDFILRIEEGVPVPKIDNKLLVIKPRTQFNVNLGKPGSPEAKVGAIFLSADGGRVAASNPRVDLRKANEKIQIWDINEEPKKRYESDGTVTAFSPDGMSFVRVRDLNFVEIIDVESGKKLGELGYGKMTFRSADTVVGVLTGPLQVTEYEATNGKRRGSFKAPEGFVYISAPVKQGKELFIGMPKTGSVQVWDLLGKKMVREFSLSGAKLDQLWYGFTVSPNGKWISVRIGADPATKIYHATNGKIAATLPRGVGPFDAAFLPNRDIYLLPCNIADKSFLDIAAYDIDKQTFVAAFRSDKKMSATFAVSADGKVLAVGNIAGDVMIWDLTQLQ